MTLGTWAPALSLERDTVYLQPPAKIELRKEFGTGSFEGQHRLVRAAPGVTPSVHGFSYFRPITKDSIYLAWTTGFSGLTMRLAPTGDTLVGRAYSFWDFGRPEQTAAVRLRRASC